MSHFVFLGLGLLTLDDVKWSAFLKALRLLPEIMRRRRAEKAAALIADGEILRSCLDYIHAV